MKKIICYGDSNTFGYNPKDNSRFDENTRWSALLQKNLKEEYEVTNEGVCDRTGFVDNPKGSLYSAQRHFPEMLLQNNNIDILVLALGTNDLQFQYDISISTIEKGLENLINLAKPKTKNIIIIPPVILNEAVLEGFFKYQFDKESIIKSKKVGEIFSKIADKYHLGYFDINVYTQPSNLDGLHYDEKSHEIIALKLADYINKNF